MVGGSFRVFRFLPPLKLVAMMELKVALSTINKSINQITIYADTSRYFHGLPKETIQN
jgi:hypothetical protein